MPSSTTLWLPALTVSEFRPFSVSAPSWMNEVAVPPSTLNLKSVAILVPPLSLITSFLTISVPAWSSFVIVQVWLPPLATETFEQLS